MIRQVYDVGTMTGSSEPLRMIPTGTRRSEIRAVDDLCQHHDGGGIQHDMLC